MSKACRGNHHIVYTDPDTSWFEIRPQLGMIPSTQQIENYKQADPDKRPKMLGYFVGQIMKASKGQANPKVINELLLKKLNQLIDSE